MSVHALLNSMSPWDTIDDQELIKMPYERGDGEATAIWWGFEDREEWTPKDAVDAFMSRIAHILRNETKDAKGEMSKEERLGFNDLTNGMTGGGGIPKILHVFSMIADDSFEAELGIEIKKKETEGQAAADLYAYKKVNYSGAGLGQIFKALLVAFKG